MCGRSRCRCYFQWRNAAILHTLSHLHLHLTFTFRSSPSQLSGSGLCQRQRRRPGRGRLSEVEPRASALAHSPRLRPPRGGAGRAPPPRARPGASHVSQQAMGPWPQRGCRLRLGRLTKGAHVTYSAGGGSRAGRRWGVHTVVHTVAESADRDPARRRAGPARTVVRGDRATRRVLPAGRGATPTAADRRTS